MTSLRELLDKVTPGEWGVSSSTIVLAPNDSRDLAVICNTLDLVGVSGIGIHEARANAEYIARLNPSTVRAVLDRLEAIVRIHEFASDETPNSYCSKACAADVRSLLQLLNSTPRTIEIFGTGHDMAESGNSRCYIGTAFQGHFVWHIYERTN